jgi:hypothetical protein
LGRLLRAALDDCWEVLGREYEKSTAPKWDNGSEDDGREVLVERGGKRGLFESYGTFRTASGLSTKTIVSARPIRSLMRLHHSSKA